MEAEEELRDVRQVSSGGIAGLSRPGDVQEAQTVQAKLETMWNELKTPPEEIASFLRCVVSQLFHAKISSSPCSMPYLLCTLASLT